MEEINPNSNVWEPVETTVNNEEEDDWDIKVDVPIPTPPPQLTLETLNNKLLTNNNTTYNVSDLMTTPNTDSGISKESTLRVEVPIPPTPTLELLTNKQLNNNQTYIVSNLMSDSTNNVGIYKDSSLVVNVSPYLPNNFTQTLNYVGYWKWDSTSNTFIRGTGIDSSNYNLFIEPIWYDGENGSKKRIKIRNGLVYDVNTVDTDFNGAMEVNVTQNQNNQQIQRLERALKSTTRDTSNLYNSFEVEAIPPTITTDIISNGYYKFNDNWNGLVSGTSSDYNLNISVNSKINISSFSLKSDGSSPIKINTLNKASSQTSLSINANNVLICFSEYNDYYRIKIFKNKSSSTSSSTVYANDRYYIETSGYFTLLYLEDENNNKISCNDDDGNNNTYTQFIKLYKDKFNLILN